MSPSDHRDLLDYLEPLGQAHLLHGWDDLTDLERAQFRGDLERIDFAEIRRLFDASRAGGKASDGAEIGGFGAEELPATRLGDAGERPCTRAQATARGEELIGEGKVAVLLVAGGQGSRLGFDLPKGMLPVGPVSGRTLFQIFADQVLALQQRYHVRIPLLIMTSPATHAETESYFKTHDYLGLEPADTFFFVQGTMPAVDAETGQVLLQAPGKLATSPDGHGGTLAAMTRAGLWHELDRRKIEHLFYFQVDNPLVAIADPTFLGIHLAVGSEMTTQVVAKLDPLERVGNVVISRGVMRIIEYSDLPEELARLQNRAGSLSIWAGSIAVHAFHVPFLRRMSESQAALPFHLALKRVPYWDPQHGHVNPSRPNAIKFERFIFDILPHAANPWVVEVDPAEGFAPVKNAAGSAKDTLQSAQEAMLAHHARWLREVGVRVAPTVRVEISPGFALFPSDIAARLKPGTQLEQDIFL